MKRVVAFVGSARKRHTWHAVRRFLDTLESLGDVETEMVVLSDCHVETCRGCLACLNKGEEFCPFHDDRDLLIAKMMAADGVVFATPNYSFQVSAILKTFLDRLGFVFHRPRFFGKVFSGIVVQGVFRGEKILEYLDFVGTGLGFRVVPGSVLLTREPMPDAVRRKNDRLLDAQARRFHAGLLQPPFPVPRLLHFVMFRFARTTMSRVLNERWRDYRYYRDQGWFTSDFFYPVRLGPFRKALGWACDRLAAWTARRTPALGAPD